MYIIGIDPGKNGAIAVLDWRGLSPGDEVSLHKMPDSDSDLWHLLAGLEPGFAVLEKVNSMPGQGVASMFEFGRQYGRTKMACVAAGVQLELVRPAIWQARMGIAKRTGTNSEHKRDMRDRAAELFPAVKVTIQVADALLLAEYARRVWSGKTC